MNASGSVTLLVDPGQTRLVGAKLRWKRFRRWTGNPGPSACSLCGERFTEGGEPGLTSGYSVVGGGPAGQDDFVWICAVCYEGVRDHFGWTVLDTRGRPIEPVGLWEAAFGFEDSPEAPTPAGEVIPAGESY